jgi:hypothetical protein
LTKNSPSVPPTDPEPVQANPLTAATIPAGDTLATDDARRRGSPPP